MQPKRSSSSIGRASACQVEGCRIVPGLLHKFKKNNVMGYYDDEKFEVLKGRIISAIHNNGDEMIFEMEDGAEYRMYHEQDCCESVSIEDIVGDLDDLIGSPILEAEEVTNASDEGKGDYIPESFTWTFYKLGTIKGSVTIRWYGESNGYYSESVTFCKR